MQDDKEAWSSRRRIESETANAMSRFYSSPNYIGGSVLSLLSERTHRSSPE